MPALFGSQDISGAAYLQVLHRYSETGAKLGGGEHRLQSSFGGLAQGAGAGAGDQKIRIGSTAGASDTTPELVELRESKRVGAIDYQGVDVRNVQAGLYYSRADEDIEFALREGRHCLLQVALSHLAVGDPDFCLRDYAADIVGHVADVIDPVVQEIDLTLPVYLPQYRFTD